MGQVWEIWQVAGNDIGDDERGNGGKGKRDVLLEDYTCFEDVTPGDTSGRIETDFVLLRLWPLGP